MIQSVNALHNKRRFWSITKPQLIAMGVGTLLNIGVTSLIDKSTLVYPALVHPFNESLFSELSITTIITCFTTQILIFFASVYGPWVGLVMAIVGGMAGDYLGGFNFFWQMYIGHALVGFLVGLTLYRTQGHFKNGHTIAVITIIAALAQIVGSVFPDYGGMWNWHHTSFEATHLYIIEIWISTLACLVTLPSLLKLYDTIQMKIVGPSPFPNP